MKASYKNRIIVVFLFFCALYGAILVNLYSIQIKHHNFYTNLGKKQYNVTVTSFQPRAPIYDRSGKHFLAMNQDTLAAFILPKRLTSPETLKPFLRKHFPRALEDLNKHPNRNFMYIARKLEPHQIALIQKQDLADIQLLSEPNRFYPVQTAGHIVGMTNVDNKGISGLEFLFNKQLAGTPTTHRLERDARSGHFHFQKETAVQGEEGKPLHLTIDGDLQFLVAEELQATMEEFKAKEGSVIIMDPTNGEILAMATLPTFDPNSTKKKSDDYSKNRIITETFEFGSVIKVFAALAALEEGVVKADELIDCENTLSTFIDGRRVNTARHTGAGLITFSEVIEKSNNIGIAKVVKRLDKKLYDHYKRIGFGKKTHIEFPGEQAGFINPPHAWSKQSILSLSYGYEITATLLQLANAFAMIANNGNPVQPTLILNAPKEPNLEKPLYSAYSIEAIKQIMETTVLRGTAKKAHIKDYRIMCKTGTALLVHNGTYSEEHCIFSCAGIVERPGYKRVIVTFIKEIPIKNMHASTVATPLFEKVTEKMLIHEKIL